MSTTMQKPADTLEKIGETIQKKVLDLVNKGGQPAKKIKNLLDGVWLGHAIHPILVALPIGSWTLAATADLLSLADEKSDLAKVSDTAVAFGIVSALPTALTGLSNWVDMDGDERKVGTLHLLLNDAAIAAYIASWLLRKQKGQRKFAVVLSTAAYLTMSVAGYFGGELAYRLGAMVNRNAWNAPNSGAANGKFSKPLTRRCWRTVLKKITVGWLPSTIFQTNLVRLSLIWATKPANLLPSFSVMKNMRPSKSKVKRLN
jgi:uncharacterized membrane protein